MDGYRNFFFVSITLLPYRLPESLCFFEVVVNGWL